jgi:hypothetical protein
MKQLAESRYDLGYYFSRFADAVGNKYGERFDEGYQEIEERYEEVRSGSRFLDIEDIMALFDPSLPFVRDWTKPEKDELVRKMTGSGKDVATLIQDLGFSKYNLDTITDILGCFRELSLTALVLHHVYPDRFAIVSHHLASLLHITGPTVPEFYIEYCRELKIWSDHKWHTPGIKTVVDAEFALWTWYKFAYSGEPGARKDKNEFFHDSFVQERRAARIAFSLGSIEKLDLARSYLEIDPTVASMIAWRELEVRIRKIVGNRAPAKTKFKPLVDKLPPITLPANIDKKVLKDLWDRRNFVLHEGEEVEKVEIAADILKKVTAFTKKNAAEVVAS